MRRIVAQGFLCLVLLAAVRAEAAREITISYQGVVQSQGNLLDDTTGYFKFALCDLDCTATYWSNDGSSVVGSEPSASVAVTIDGGIFSILLGDTAVTNMAAIPVSVFDTAGDATIYLRVWFDDGKSGFERLTPDQRLTIVPYAVRTEMTGGLLNLNSVAMTGNLGITIADFAATSGYAFKVSSASSTLFSVNEKGTATSRDVVLTPLTSSSDLARTGAGRIFYDGTANVFKGCNNSTCAEIGLAGATGVADITSVTAGTGLTGGGTSGAVTLAADTSVVVTKTGDHTMTGALTTSTLSTTTATATTVNATTVTATGTVTGNAFSTTGTATTGGLVMPPTGTAAGNTAEAQFRELAANGTHYVGFKAPDSIILSKIWTLPTGDGTAGQVLSTDGSGALSWASDANAGGDITAVTAGLGLTGGSTSGSASVAVGLGTGITATADTVDFDYSRTLANETSLTAGQAVFDSGDSGGGILFEGATANAVEGLLTVADPTTTDKTWTLPDATGTIIINTNCVSVVAGEFNPTEAGATNDYLNLVDNTFSATETDEDMFMAPVAMVARNLRAEVDVAPGVGNDPWTVTLRDDAASTTLTCSIDESATNCSDTSNAPSIAAGSKLAILVTSSGADADPLAAAALTVSFCLGQ